MQRVWRNFLSVSVQMTEQLDQELQKNSQISLTDFEILLVLSEAPDSRLRMSELARQVLVSRSRLTYRVDRLTQVGYVTREECEDDRRGLWAIITNAGRQALDRAGADHHRDIRNLFFDGLTADELDLLESVFQRLDSKLLSQR